MQLLQWRAGVGAELVGQLAAEMVVGGQGIGRAAAPVQGDDPLPLQLFVEREPGHQLVELTDHVGVPAEGEFGGELGLERGHPLVGQPSGLRLDEVVVGQVGEHLTPPQGQRMIELGDRVRG